MKAIDWKSTPSAVTLRSSIPPLDICSKSIWIMFWPYATNQHSRFLWNLVQRTCPHSTPIVNRSWLSMSRPRSTNTFGSSPTNSNELCGHENYWKDNTATINWSIRTSFCSPNSTSKRESMRKNNKPLLWSTTDDSSSVQIQSSMKWI